MLQAPRFFAGEIKLGDVHQTVQSFNRLMTALSFFRLFYEQFTLYQARINRLQSFLQAIDELDNKQPNHTQPNNPTDTPAPTISATTPQEQSAQLCLNQVGLTKVEGGLLFSPVSVSLGRGDRLLIMGESGIGKSSLLRAIAGLYPLPMVGAIDIAMGLKLWFVPQRSYTPQGSLRAVVCYPVLQADDDTLIRLMCLCGLDNFVHRLDEVADWQHILSPGQIHRIGFVRILLVAPDVVFLDEATSALDEQNERRMYELLNCHLPHAIIVSVGHGSTLIDYHNRQLCLVSENKSFYQP
ncbi:ATP-binding cassette domain-containing protein [Moraxella nasicaprae]|uniref:ATP-binding cassette domain-containing protein n=1 Tax=Moraxella nasicaprae TaxID=2904122 RepID=A0ABY6F5J3_9GAMM|nr:ATP-binding cassette domain-containing protein [Moraxella nasicaprae]UXZ05366.1 ATP-binding cassette domain-containing protein [Moraxella nasicaprae]